MKEYVKNEIEDVILIKPITEFTELRVTKIGNAGKIESIDIRQWFNTKSDSTKKQSKGIRLSVTDLSDIVNVLNEQNII